MPDFEPLDDEAAARFRRWQRFDTMRFSARVLLAQSSVRAAIAQLLEGELDPADPLTPALRSRLLRVRAAAIKWGHRAIAVHRVATMRLASLIDVRRGR
jgi:hypothetical protein